MFPHDRFSQNSTCGFDKASTSETDRQVAVDIDDRRSHPDVFEATQPPRHSSVTVAQRSLDYGSWTVASGRPATLESRPLVEWSHAPVVPESWVLTFGILRLCGMPCERPDVPARAPWAQGALASCT